MRKTDLNAIYISERVQETLRPVSVSALTAVVAPMGYGKTTAVNWFLNQRRQTEAAVILRVNIYSDNRFIFWKSVQNAFAAAGLTALAGCEYPEDASSAAQLMDDLCAVLAGDMPCYLFLDDFHLLKDEKAAKFLCELANRLPTNIHLIVASRNNFLPKEEILRLGHRLHRIGREQLRLNHTELAHYAHRCGMDLTEAQVESLLRSCEGWFSAIYLNLHSLAERGILLSEDADIYSMFTAAMLENLPSQKREFLAVMGLADEFTVEMARVVTEMPDAEEILLTLTEQNAFVTRLPDGKTFRFHHMLKECAVRLFARLAPEKQDACRERYGAWYEAKQQYLHALTAYEACKDYDAALQVIERGAGILLFSLDPAELLERLGRCPGLLALCEALHYDLVALHLRIQMAAAYARLGRQDEGLSLLQQALAQAAPDGFVVPFAENFRDLKPLLEAAQEGPHSDAVRRILAPGAAQEERCRALTHSEALPEAAARLTERELTLARLIADRCTNKEIAAKMFLSEGTVKQYTNQLYSKLGIGGGVRTKRAQLAELFAKKY